MPDWLWSPAQLAYEAWVVRKEGRDDPAADPIRTPGALAYATWVHLTPSPGDVRRPWHLLEPETRALWEAIAQAVRQAADNDA